jgi:hypothetical protein
VSKVPVQGEGESESIMRPLASMASWMHVGMCTDVVPLQESVDASTGDGHFAETGFHEFEDGRDDGRINVRHLHVVDVPCNDALFAVDGGIGDAKVVRVEDETFGGEYRGEKVHITGVRS